MKKTLFLSLLLMVRIFLSAQNITVSGPPALKIYAGSGNPNGNILHPNSGELFLSSQGSLWVNTNASPYGWVQLSSGNTGITGTTGATGATGTRGLTGATGAAGQTGITGATGLQGQTGTNGATGQQGTTGLVGATGSVGITGATGNIGGTGSTGATGGNGTNGATGPTGLQGITGSAGATGNTSWAQIGTYLTPVSALGIYTTVRDSMTNGVGNTFGVFTPTNYYNGGNPQPGGFEYVYYLDTTDHRFIINGYTSPGHLVFKAGPDVGDFGSSMVGQIRAQSANLNGVAWLYVVGDSVSPMVGWAVGTQNSGNSNNGVIDENSFNIQDDNGNNVVTVNTTTNAGYLQYQDGHQAAGKVLTSDVSGIATWQSTSSLVGPTGATGPSGSNGTNGATGATGATGIQGVTGVTGPTGGLSSTGIIGTSSTPSISAGSGAGTSPTISIQGTNIGGIINVTPGITAAAGATLVTVTYSSLTYGNDSYVVLYPNNAATALLSGVTMVYATGTTTTFVITTGTSALTPATAYSWNYIIVGN